MDCSPPGSSVHGILQARILEWVLISFSRWSSWPRDRTCLLHLLHCRRILYLLSHWGSSWGIAFEAISGSWNPYHQEMGCAALSVRIQSRNRKCISCFKREHLIQIIGKQLLENEKGQERNESIIKRVTARSSYHPYLWGIIGKRVESFQFRYLFLWLCRVLVAACGILDLYCGMGTLSCRMWDLVPWPEIKPRPPALGVSSLSHGPPGKSWNHFSLEARTRFTNKKLDTS